MPPQKNPEIVVSGHLAWLTKKLGIEPWGQILIALLLTASITISGFLWSFNGRMSHVEGQLSILVAGRRIDEVAQYAKSQNLPKVTTAAEGAKASLTLAAKKKVPAPPEYFQMSIATLDSVNAANGPELEAQLQKVRIALAEYRSALQPPPKIDEDLRNLPVQPGVVTPNMVGERAVYRMKGNLTLPPKTNLVSDGAVFNGSEIPEGTSLLNPKTNSIALNQNEVSGLIIIARNQTLDGIIWKNVTFVNTHVVYAGGEVTLENVKFINCTFDSPATKQGSQVIEYAALLESLLRV
jgi:hypothetical protein